MRKLFRADPSVGDVLSWSDPAATPGVGSRKNAERELTEIGDDLAELQERLFAEHTRSLLIVLQGMDTSGKDGTVNYRRPGNARSADAQPTSRPGTSCRPIANGRNRVVAGILREVLDEIDPRYPSPELDVERLKARLAPPH